jgi:hypothetical protein
MPHALRSDVIKLLEQLGAERDEDALAAARALDQAIVEAGWTWDELLVPESVGAPSQITSPPSGSEQSAPASNQPGAEEPTESNSAPDVSAGSPESREEVLLIIERLLARKDLADEARSDLAAFRSDLDKGMLSEMDREYLRALGKRLGL